MKRIYIEAFTSTNFGDDLFVRMLCNRYPNTKFYINTSRFDDSAFENITNLTIMNRAHMKGMIIHNFKKLLNKMHIDINFPYDGQMYIGGSIFPEPADWLTNDWHRSHYYSKKQGSKLPYYIIGANFGPYFHEDFKEFIYQYVNSYVDGICFRDQYSYNIFSNINHVAYAPDIVFSLDMHESTKENLIIMTVINNDHRSEIDDYDENKYISKIVELINYYHSIDKEVVLVSFCSKQNDEKVIQSINCQVMCKCKVVNYNGNIDEILDLFSKCEYVIGTRFHSMVLGMNVRVPVYPISYSNKTRNVLSDMNYLGNWSNINEFYNKSIEEIDANRKNRYVMDIQKIKKEANNQFKMIDEVLGKSYD